MSADEKIDGLIRPPRVVYVMFDWGQAHKLRPTGDAARERVVAEKLRPNGRQEDAG